MRLTFEEIATKVSSRRLSGSVLLDQMIKVRDRYNGDYVIPLPNTDDELPMPPLMPAIIANAVDNTALRAGSMTPTIYCPALDMTKDTGKRSLEYASIRRRALAYTYSKSYWGLNVRRGFRHLAGYATTGIQVSPDFKMECPKITFRDPLSTFPEPKAPEDLSPPCDVAFVYQKSVDWLAYNYPETRAFVGRSGLSTADAQMWDVVEWNDEHDVVIGILGPSYTYRTMPNDPLRFTMELRRYANYAGRCTAYIPRRITLDRIATQVANMVGLTDLMAMLVALDIRATEKSIYPDKYVLGRVGQSPQLLSGAWKPGYTGEVNVILDAEAVGQLHGTPDPHNTQTIDRLERAANLSMGVVPQMGGESYGALRTGRGIDSLMGAAVDPRVQELHEIMEVAMQHTNEIVFDTYKGYWGSRSYSVHSGWATDKGQVTFTPDKHFETDDNVVSYPIPGADVQTATVILGQLKGMDAISLRTLRTMHPYVEDPDAEEQQWLVEELTRALNAANLQRASQGGFPPIDAARVISLVKKGSALEDAVAIADQEAKQRQATEAPQPGPGMGAAPEAQPGLGNPGEGGQMMEPPSIPPPDTNLANLRRIVSNLRAPNAGVGVNAR